MRMWRSASPQILTCLLGMAPSQPTGTSPSYGELELISWGPPSITPPQTVSSISITNAMLM